MTRYLLDTNIISNVVKTEPSEALLVWMAAQRDEDLFIASLMLAKIRRGILEAPCGKKREALTTWFAGPEGPQALFSGRILPFDRQGRPDLGEPDSGGQSCRTTSQRTRHDHRRRCQRRWVCGGDR